MHTPRLQAPSVRIIDSLKIFTLCATSAIFKSTYLLGFDALGIGLRTTIFHSTGNVDQKMDVSILVEFYGLWNVR